MPDAFIVARNPEADSSLPYLVFLPTEGGTWLTAREVDDSKPPAKPRTRKTPKTPSAAPSSE